jgi:hypothetical protein
VILLVVSVVIVIAFVYLDHHFADQPQLLPSPPLRNNLRSLKGAALDGLQGRALNVSR